MKLTDHRSCFFKRAKGLVVLLILFYSEFETLLVEVDLGCKLFNPNFSP